MKFIFNTIIVAGLATALVACGSTEKPQHEFNKNMPDWVLNPSFEGGLASATCVIASGNLNLDKNQATALGRVDLAQQINTRVKALDKTYTERIDVDNQAQVGNTFSSVSKQLTDQAIQGSRTKESSYAEFDQKKQLCVLTVLDPSATQSLFNNLVSASGRKLDPKDERVLYQEFKAHKAQKELEAEMYKEENR
jgi:hypothetical protein